MPAQQQTRKILIQVDAGESKAALDQIAKSMGGVSKSTKTMASDMGFLTDAFKGWIAVLSIKEVANISDEMQNLSNRLKVVITDGTSAGDTLTRIIDISKRTYQPVHDVGQVFTTLATVMKGVNPTVDELSALTEGLIDAMKLSGTSGAQMSGAINQLGHALISNTVHVRELRFLLNDIPILAEVLQKKFGSQLFKDATDGAIKASDVIRALSENLDDIISGAAEMKPTFEQSNNIIKDQFYQTIFNLNEQLGISGIYFKIAATVAQNFNAVLLGLLPAVVALVVQTGYLQKAIKSLLAGNLVGWLVLLGAAFVEIAIDCGGLQNVLLLLANTWTTVEIATLSAYRASIKWIPFTGQVVKGIDDQIASLEELFRKRTLEYQANKKSAEANSFSALSQKALNDMIEDYQDKLDSLADKEDKHVEHLDKWQELLKRLNKAYQSGAIGIDEYAKKFSQFEVAKMNIELRDGKKNVFDLKDAMDKFNMEAFNRGMANGGVSIDRFNTVVANLQKHKLDRDFKAGRITLDAYNEGIIALKDNTVHLGAAVYTGTQKYLASIGTFSQGISTVVTQAFGHLEDAFIEFTKTGKFNFNTFAQAVLDDLNKIIIRSLIIAPLAKGLLNLIPGSTPGPQTTVGDPGGTVTPSAKGNAFYNGALQKFATGGVVSSPTLFGFGGGKTGLMGEAGSEAILPLSRGSGGDLGVKASVTPVTVNVINQSGAQASTTESTGPSGEKIIEVLIINKVREGIVSGKFDGANKSAYGLNRKGS